MPADVEVRDSRFHQSLIAEWFGTSVFVLFLLLVWMDGWMVGWIHGMDGWMNGLVLVFSSYSFSWYGWMDGWMGR